jgi:hypothetical protein
MIVRMMKDLWRAFTAPMRPRPPLRDWTSDLLNPSEKHEIAEANREITRQTQRLERELSLIDRDHGKG